jgi:acyl carrier protein
LPPPAGFWYAFELDIEAEKSWGSAGCAPFRWGGKMKTADAVATHTEVASPLERELAALIVAALSLDVAAEQIEPEAPLFGEGLGLDSIDALEMALAISKAYGVQLKSDDERNHQIFASLRSLAAHIAQHRTR